MFGKLFGKEEKDEDVREIEEFAELPVEVESRERMNIVIEKLEDFTDTDRIIRKLRSGHVVIVSIKSLREKSMDELKHAIAKFKTSVSVMDGDIVGVANEWVILTPPNAKVSR